MTPLLVSVEDLDTGARSQLAFERSPVRIGRSELNDLPLPQPFVSTMHAVVRFDERQTLYADLGSTNGSLVNGSRVESNAPVPIGPGTEVVIGRLRLTFARRSAAEPAAAAPFSTMFAERVAGLGAGTPPPVPAAGGAAAALLRALAASYLPPPVSLAGREEMEAFLRRVAEALEACCRSFVEMRKAAEESGRELGIPPARAEGPIARARDAGELLRALLDPAQRGRAEELQRAFAELMAHQLALLGASRRR
jgi:predicted component of type VI protein secretion system